MKKFSKRTLFVGTVVLLTAVLFLRPDPDFTPRTKGKERAQGQLRIKVLNWNILRGSEDEAVTNWKERKKAYRALLSQSDFDVLGFQEVLPEQLSYLRSVLKDYDVVAAGRRDGQNRGEHNPVFFRKDKFELVASETFWLSETPQAPSTGWGEFYPRICTWIELRDKNTGTLFRVYNTHIQLSPYAQPYAARLIAKHIADAGKPALLMGDFNSHLKMSLNIFRDHGLLSSDTAGGTTYHVAGKGLFRLDHILMTRDWSAADGAIIRRKVNGIYPSDHFGLWAALDFTVPGAH